MNKTTELNKGQEKISGMFNNIAHRYDFLNHFLTFGIDRYWRKKAIRVLAAVKPDLILDIATGTGDLAIESIALKPKKITGIDISEEMLSIGRKKILKKKLEEIIELQSGDVENLSFADNSFDAVTIAFGVRNFNNLEKAISEIYRVLNKNGTLVILEFSHPKKISIKLIYEVYFNMLLPFFGKIISKDKFAYKYLVESVYKFMKKEDFINLLEKSKFSNVSSQPLTFDIVTMYSAKKDCI